MYSILQENNERQILSTEDVGLLTFKWRRTDTSGRSYVVTGALLNLLFGYQWKVF